MKVTLLGTGTSQGIPLIGCACEVCHSKDPRDKRLRSSVLIEWNGHQVVIDSGPDFRYQMIRAGVKQLDALLFTHEHRDHTAGLDDIRAFNFLQSSPIDVYATKWVFKNLVNNFSYIFSENKYPGVPEIQKHVIGAEPFNLLGENIIPIQVLHHQLPVLGFRIQDFCYITDANHIEEAEKEKIRGAKILVLNALRRKKHISHFTLEEAISMAKELQVGQVYFTHLSHQMGLHTAVSAELPEGVNLAYDGLCLNF